jgi:hypothetical protein
MEPNLPWAAIVGLAGGLLGMATHGRKPATALISAAFAASGFAWHPALGDSAALAGVVGAGIGAAASRLASRDRQAFPVGIFAWPLAGFLGAGAGLIHPLLVVPIGAAAAYLASHLDGRSVRTNAQALAAARLDAAAIISFSILAAVPMVVGIGATLGLGLIAYWPLIGNVRMRSKLRSGADLVRAPILMGVKSLAAFAASTAGLLAFWFIAGLILLGSVPISAGWLGVVFLIAGQGALLGAFASVGSFRLRQAGFKGPAPNALPAEDAALMDTST